MTQYECCYSSGRQFVYIERTFIRSIDRCLPFVALFGLLLGLSLGLTLCVGGILCFDLGILIFACWATIYAYHLVFQRISSSRDWANYAIFCLFLGFCLGALRTAVRYSLLLDLNAPCKIVFFGAACSILGSTAYIFAFAYCHEDERKHHLAICSPSGDPLPVSSVVSHHQANDYSLWRCCQDFGRFVSFLVKSQWLPWGARPTSSADGGVCVSASSIHVHNRSMKLIKVCIYAHDDMFNWVPIGGISGCCVGLIRAGEFRTFSPPWHPEAEGGFRVKVFEPGLIDKELACFPKAERGQVFAFYDTEGMVKRSSTLSSHRSKAERVAMESSESEFDRSPSPRRCTTGPDNPNVGSGLRDQRNGIGFDCPDASLGLRRAPSASHLLGRNSTASRLRPLVEQEAEADPLATPLATPPRTRSARRAAPSEILVRNRTNQAIRALLFKSTDYSFLVPLVGGLLAYGDQILPWQEQRFDPTGTDEEFTLKIYSVGPGAEELTYLTVERGQAYNLGHSLLA